MPALGTLRAEDFVHFEAEPLDFGPEVGSCYWDKTDLPLYLAHHLHPHIVGDFALDKLGAQAYLVHRTAVAQKPGKPDLVAAEPAVDTPVEVAPDKVRTLVGHTEDAAAPEGPEDAAAPEGPEDRAVAEGPEARPSPADEHSAGNRVQFVVPEASQHHEVAAYNREVAQRMQQAASQALVEGEYALLEHFQRLHHLVDVRAFRK